MNREIKFKAKNFDNDWIKGHYLKIHNMSYMATPRINYVIDPSTLCQLITKINDVEIYEYDCYFDIKNNRIEYFSYEINGQLGVQSYLLKNNKLEHIHYTLNLEVVKCLRKSILKNDYKYIGNFHDGEEYLLNKIKEVENE